MSNADTSSAAVREDLEARVVAWRLQLPPDGASVGTYGHGMLDKAKERLEILIHRAVEALLPGVPLRAKPTLRDYIDALAKDGPGLSSACLGQPGPLVTDADIAVLERFLAARNALAHPDEATVRAWLETGGPDASEIRAFLDLVGAVVRLRVFDEVICREGGLTA